MPGIFKNHAAFTVAWMWMNQWTKVSQPLPGHVMCKLPNSIRLSQIDSALSKTSHFPLGCQMMANSHQMEVKYIDLLFLRITEQWASELNILTHLPTHSKNSST